MYFTKVIRETELEIFCDDWDEDESVGIPFGPYHIYAIDSDGNDFPLTDKETAELFQEALVRRLPEPDDYI